MRLVIADTAPLNYLVLIQTEQILPKLFDKIFIPAVVRDELASKKAPALVREWIAEAPPWLDIRPNPENMTDSALSLDIGECAAITLASTLKANLILMDDRAGVIEAHRQGFKVTGTLGVLDLAADKGLIQFIPVINRLKQTNFRYPPETINALLTKHKQKSRKQ